MSGSPVVELLSRESWPLLVAGAGRVADSRADRLQHEHKYLVDAREARALWAAACAQLAPPEHPSRRLGFVRTTYFDTLDLAYYRSARGPLARRVRVREYAPAAADGTPVLAERCFLELKQSAGGQRSKLRLELLPGEVAAHLERHPDAPLAPVLTTWYRRRVLADRDERVRITLDNDVCYCAPCVLGSPCDAPLRVVERCGPLILEVKRFGEAPSWLTRALRGLDEATRFSKFSAGMRALASAG